MKRLNKEINIKVIIFLLLINILGISFYSSYALFEVSVVYDNVVIIKTGTVDIETIVSNSTDQTFQLASGETKNVTVNLSSTASGSIGYKMYYDITSGISNFIVTSTETFTNDIVEGVMTTSKTITLTLQNTGNEDLTIYLGTQGGLSAYPIILEQGLELVLNEKLGVPIKNVIVNAVNNPTNTSCKTKVEEDGITYISGTKECIDFNYVWYSGKLWRITAIYPDGTMKMVTEDVITTINWGATSTISSTDLTSAYGASWIREWLNQEFLPTLYNHENIIVEDAGWYSIVDTASTPTKPTGDYTLTDPVGLLSAYEYYMSYKNTASYHSKGYLNITYYWWLITPYDSSKVRYIGGYSGSDFVSTVPNTYSNGVRPSINLKSTIQLSDGSGTKVDPYKIKGDIEESIPNTTFLNTRQSGEYVKIEGDTTGQVFRIVNKEKIGENITTKLVLKDYVKDSETILNKKFSSSSNEELWTEVSLSDETYWRGYLNTTWLQNFNTNMLEKGIYYLGYYEYGSYKTTVCSTVSTTLSINECIDKGAVVSDTSSTDYVGLLRVGEMFATQQDNSIWSSDCIWLITPYNSSKVMSIILSANLESENPSGTYSYAVYPTIHLKSEIVIKSGSGTEEEPFVVGLPSS